MIFNFLKSISKMKKCILISYLLIISAITFAQNKKYVAAIEKNLAMLKSAKTADEFQNAANSFERIASAETKEWLPLYWQAYASILCGMQQNVNAKKDEYFDKALSLLDKANSISKDNSEIYALKSWATSMKISIDPQTRGMELSMQAGVYISTAMKLNPANPRPYFLKGTGLLYTPEQYGGGKDKACPMLKTALEKFDAFKPENTLLPDWGKERCAKLYEECK